LEVSNEQNPVCFTLDAGANVHVLYPENDSAAVLQFIKDELVLLPKWAVHL
jgi:diphosphomevalonate decarboxylase